MKKEQIFLGENGLTSTSANHVSNLAKEQYLATENLLKSARFYNEDIKLIGEESSRLKNGWTGTLLSGVPELLDEVAELKSLIAWFREGIKAKDKMLDEVKALNFEDWAEQQGIEIPAAPDDKPEKPVKETPKKRDDILAAMTIKERNRLLQVETIAAVYGSYVHPDGDLSEARKEFEKVCNDPSTYDGQGRDTIIHTYTPSVDREEVEAMFFEIQHLYREAQAELNGLNHKIDKEIEDDENRIAYEYTLKMNEYRSKLDAYHNKQVAWSVQYEALQAQMEEWRQKEIQRISQLKIIIPNDLREVYEKVNSLGKQ